MKRRQYILKLVFLGVNASIKRVRIVNVAIECPEGKLVYPESFSPIITKLELSKIAAGLGTANIFFRKFEKIAESIREVNNDCQNLGQ